MTSIALQDGISVATEMSIARIDNANYPSIEIENHMFSRYFAEPKILKNGDFFCILQSCFESSDPLPLSFLVDNFIAFPYIITDVQPQLSLGSCFIASKSYSKFYKTFWESSYFTLIFSVSSYSVCSFSS